MERPTYVPIEGAVIDKLDRESIVDFTVDIERRLSARRELTFVISLESVPTRLIKIGDLLKSGRWIDKELVDQFLSDLPPGTFGLVRNTFDKAGSGYVKISTTMKIFPECLRDELEELLCLDDDVLAGLGAKRTASGDGDVMDELSILSHLGGPEWLGPRKGPHDAVA
jgi:hypothetical protein